MAASKWTEIADSIRSAIEAGAISPGDRVACERDLATTWGVSRMTVHRAMRNLQETGWVTRQPRNGTVVAGPEARRTRQIAMLYYNDATILEATYLQGVRSAIPDETHVLICMHRDDPKREARLIQRVRRDVDGIILLGTSAPENNALIKRAAEEGLAIVCIDRVPMGLPVDSVVTDNYGATLDALRHVVSRGHSRIAFFTADIPHVSSAQERFEGYLQASQEAGVADPSRWVRAYPLHDTSNPTLIARLVADALAAMLSSSCAPTAAFCLNDYMLAPLLEACEDLGVSVPRDFEIVSFSDSLNLMRRHAQSVHRIVQRPAEAGSVAVGLLVERLAHPDRDIRSIRLPADFYPAQTDA